MGYMFIILSVLYPEIMPLTFWHINFERLAGITIFLMMLMFSTYLFMMPEDKFDKMISTMR
jgi:hypothetical protein